MNSSDYVMLIIGMTLVTYIPRALPAAFVGRMRFRPRAKKFLRLIPYTAISALIFPGILLVDSAHPSIGIAGALAAGLAAWRGMPLMVCVLTAIGVNFLMYLSM